MLVREGKFAQLHSIMEMGRGEGMYTAEAYISEYLDKPQRFSAPANVFRPTPDEEHQPDHESPLVDHGLGTTHYAPESARHLARSGAPQHAATHGSAAQQHHAHSGELRHDDSDEQTYILTDEGRLEDILREFTTS